MQITDEGDLSNIIHNTPVNSEHTAQSPSRPDRNISYFVNEIIILFFKINFYIT